MRRLSLVFILTLSAAAVPTAQRPSTTTIVLRGHSQTVHLYGTRGHPAVIVSSGDGGWIHLGPHVADTLAARGFFVVGFDVKAYLESFTSGRTTLRAEDEPADYKMLADFAAQGSPVKPILAGVSEGAGLSVLAATDPNTKGAIAGVIGMGLPDLNELGWRWKDMLIYVTHGLPSEPTFSTAAIAAKVSPVPLAVLQSSNDEFVKPAELQRVIDAAREPKKVWMIKAADHRFSDNLVELDRTLLEAVAWITAQRH
jgi:alpha-beta hydrolase superfamily lysophospholipase